MPAILSVAQDKEGFIWLSSSKGGAYRFDGRNFRLFLKNDGFTNSISTELYRDSHDYLWLCTNTDGLFKYDGKRFIRYKITNIPKHISTICETGNLYWIGVDKDLYCFNGDRFRKVLSSSSRITSIKSDMKGNIWILTWEGLYSYCIKSGKMQTEVLSKDINAVFFDKKGNKWYTYNNKIIKFGPNGSLSLKLPSGSGNIVPRNIIEDSYGNIWFATNLGLFKYNGSKLECINLSKYMSDNFCFSVFEDFEKNIWVGTTGSLSKLQKNDFGFLENEIRELKSTRFINEDNNGNYWFFTDHKILKYSCGKVKTFNIPEAFCGKAFLAGIRDKNGNIWLASSNALLKFDGKSFYPYYYTFKGLPFLNRLFYDISARGLALGNNGKILLRQNTDQIEEFDGKSFRNISLKNDSLNFCRLLREKFKQNWFEAGKNKIAVFNGQYYKTVNIKYSETNHFIEDEKNLYIINTYEKEEKKKKNSFYIINKSDGKVKCFGEKDGMTQDEIRIFCKDKLNNLWIFVRGKGIVKFDISESEKTGKLKFYEYPFPDSYKDQITICHFVDSKGNIWVSNFTSWICFNPAEFGKIEPLIPKTYLISATLFSRNRQIQLYDSNNSLSKQTQLPYYDNYIKFQFGAVCFRDNEHVKYTYILEGLDTKWSELTNSDEITYTNLPPGKYRFRARVCSIVGSIYYESIYGAPAEFSFEILPPFWKTWWFYLITLAVMSGAYFFILKFWENRIQKRDLERLVNLRTKQLQEEKERVETINRELEKSKYQLFKINEIQTKWLDELSDSEQQLIELNKNKDEFFSIISHDLKSPFYSIIRYTESFLSDFNKLTSDQIKEYTKALNSSSKSVYDLLEKLLDWSRIQTGRMEYKPVCYELTKQISNVVDLHTGHLNKKKIKFVNNIQNEIFVYADENMIRSVLSNFISNAIKFTPNGGKIQVSSSMLPDYVEIRVADTGIGIDSESFSKLFRINHHFTTLGTSKEKGTGLGLIICKEFVEMNKGKIFAESTPGKGSTFGFTLPLPTAQDN
ncbi:MAG: ATP-binding protein [Bacteroidota bacterium]|nr:ATP-binding protein [Bacteroidota bacterium]MDP4191983.1 ATP-binding protein [Bacteroidota bacterium]MDP4196087.1 ATP-binding protein [Bacteroidota bacterium]